MRSREIDRTKLIFVLGTVDGTQQNMLLTENELKIAIARAIDAKNMALLPHTYCNTSYCPISKKCSLWKWALCIGKNLLKE